MKVTSIDTDRVPGVSGEVSSMPSAGVFAAASAGVRSVQDPVGRGGCSGDDRLVVEVAADGDAGPPIQDEHQVANPPAAGLFPAPPLRHRLPPSLNTAPRGDQATG